MIGIYKITNKESGKSYIGQSNDIERRFAEHKRGKIEARCSIDMAINKYGKDAFDYEVIEECPIEKLNEREEYWIAFYDTLKNGYNCTPGGSQQSIGENNGRAKLTTEDVILIRTAYANHEKQLDVYQNFCDKISWSSFQAAWQGRTWANVMPEVFTKENKDYYIYSNSKGENSVGAIFTDEEVIELRKRYVNETAKEIYEDYQDRLKYNTLQQILWGRVYKDLPIYKKKEKKWINI